MVMPSNARAAWRNIRESVGLGWVAPHHMRKTSLTMIKETYSSIEAAAFAGHGSVDVLERYYIARDREGLRPDVRTALDALAPAGFDPPSLNGTDRPS